MNKEQLRGLLETVADGMTTVDQAACEIMLAIAEAYQDGIDGLNYEYGED